MAKSKNPRNGVALLSTGDVDPLTYGGGLLYYQPEYDSFSWDFWDEPDAEEIEDATYRVYRFSYGVHEDLFDGPLSWVKDDIASIADSVGMDADELRKMGSGDTDPLVRWQAAREVEAHWGAENLDSYPLELSHSDMINLYGVDLDVVARRSFDETQRTYNAAKKRAGNPGAKTKKKGKLKNPSYEEFTISELDAMPTVSSGHMHNLKYDDGRVRYWLSRMSVEDGETNAIYVEELQDGRWVDVHQYGDVQAYDAMYKSTKVPDVRQLKSKLLK